VNVAESYLSRNHGAAVNRTRVVLRQFLSEAIDVVKGQPPNGGQSHGSWQALRPRIAKSQAVCTRRSVGSSSLTGCTRLDGIVAKTNTTGKVSLQALLSRLRSFPGYRLAYPFGSCGTTNGQVLY
jgi:hypothetical protein